MGNTILKKFFKTKKENLDDKQQSEFFQLSALDIQLKEFQFSQLKGKKAILIVNVASQCGLSKQHYSELVALYNKYQKDGLEILAFPCNQFYNNESKCEKYIESFVKINMKAQFLLFQKVNVNGENTHPVFKFLRLNSSLHDPLTGLTLQVPFNFSKFLLDGNGIVKGFFPPTITPLEIASEIEDVISASLQTIELPS